jgi:tripartite-type tricarboxylate transporter receptor subunit TctC
MAFGTVPAIAEHVRAGRPRALAVTGATWSALLPDVASMAEAGLPQVDAASVSAPVGPAGLPEPIVERLALSSRAVVTGPAIRERLAEFGFDPIGSTAREKHDGFAAEIPRCKRIVRQGGMTASAHDRAR